MPNPQILLDEWPHRKRQPCFEACARSAGRWFAKLWNVAKVGKSPKRGGWKLAIYTQWTVNCLKSTFDWRIMKPFDVYPKYANQKLMVLGWCYPSSLNGYPFGAMNWASQADDSHDCFEHGFITIRYHQIWRIFPWQMARMIATVRANTRSTDRIGCQHHKSMDHRLEGRRIPSCVIKRGWLGNPRTKWRL